MTFLKGVRLCVNHALNVCRTGSVQFSTVYFLPSPFATTNGGTLGQDGTHNQCFDNINKRLPSTVGWAYLY